MQDGQFFLLIFILTVQFYQSSIMDEENFYNIKKEGL